MIDITVVVCTYNRCGSLAEALASIAAQIVPSPLQWEILIVDNNSTDRTRDVVSELGEKWPGRFRYVAEPRQGLSLARNTGIQEARGAVLAFTDDDVTVEPEWLRNLTANLHSGEWAGAGGRIVPVWSKPIPKWLSTSDPHTMGPFVAFDAGSDAGALNRPPYGANMAFHREVFERCGGFRTDLGRTAKNLHGREDIEFGNRVLASGLRLRYEPNAVVYHPAPESRMKKSFVLRWWFGYGQAEIIEAGRPAEGKRIFCGVPLVLFRRIVRWYIQSIFSFNSKDRFASKRNVWYLAGIIQACYRQAGQQGVSAQTASEE